jgi:DNA polymerase II
MKGFIIYPTYKIINKKPCVLLYGRLENNQTFLTVNEFKPYFYIKTKDLKKAKKLEKNIEFEETKKVNFSKEKVTKVILGIPKEVPIIRDRFEESKIKTYEADVRFEYRFLIDNNIKGSIEINGDYNLENEVVDRLYKNPEIKSSDYDPSNLKILSMDIETNSDGKDIYCIGLYSKDYRKSLIISDKKFPNTISCKNEKELLELFQEEVLKFDPDIITGWSVIDFDLACIKRNFQKYQIPFILGKENKPCTINIAKEFFRTSKARFPGRIVLDGLDLVRNSFIKLDNYKLNTAAKKILGKTKIIEKLGSEKSNEIDYLFKKDQKKLLEYNLMDSILVYEILKKGKVMDLTIERSKLIGLPLDRINATIASLDFLYLQKANSRNMVSPTRKFKEKKKPITGGYVKESIPGIYDNLIVLDFKSLYPSIMRTFNVDPSTVLDKKEKGAIGTPAKIYFKKERGVLPEVLEELWKARDKIKERKDKIASFAIKTVMASFIGGLGNPSCRFFNPNLGNAITKTGQFLIKQTAELIEKKGHKVIYSDTDSIFIDSKLKSKEEAEKLGKKLEKQINTFYEKHIKEEYKVQNYLELEYEKCYNRFLMPKVRSGESGAKKRYAGLLKENGKEQIEIVGLEFQRSDWTQAAKKFQKELLDRIFHKKEVTNFVKKFVEDIKKGNYDEDLVYRKSLRKGLEGYKVNPPHLKAAKKLKKLESNIIEYYITTDGPEPIQNLKNKIDYNHYIKKQIKPIAETILDFFDITFDELLEGKKQTKLFDF